MPFRLNLKKKKRKELLSTASSFVEVLAGYTMDEKFDTHGTDVYQPGRKRDPFCLR